MLAFPPQAITSPLATEAADSSFTGIDFVPGSFVRGPVRAGAALYVLEGDFGFSPSNATEPAHEVGHEVKLINFSPAGKPLQLEIQDFAHNDTFDQAFVTQNVHGLNRPTNVRMGPDACAWIVDYGAVRDLGQSGADSKFVGPPRSDRSCKSLAPARSGGFAHNKVRAISRAGWLLAKPAHSTAAGSISTLSRLRHVGRY